MPNEGLIQLNMECGNVPLQSVFQVAGVTRPQMSFGRVCDQGLKCIFDEEKSWVVDRDGEEVCRFERRGGLYVARLKLKNPEHFSSAGSKASRSSDKPASPLFKSTTNGDVASGAEDVGRRGTCPRGRSC